MSAENVAELLRDFELFYGPKFQPTEEATAYYVKEFKDVGVECLLWANIEIKNKSLYPSVQVVKEYVVKAREALWQKQKDTELRNPRPISQPRASSGLIREGLPIVGKYLAGELTKREYVDALFDLEAKYPGRGCGELARSLEKQWKLNEADGAEATSGCREDGR